MKDLIQAKKELIALNNQVCKVIGKNKASTADIKNHKLAKSRYLRIWKKYTKNKRQTKSEFLKINQIFAELEVEWYNRREKNEKAIAPIRNKMIICMKKITKLVKKQEKSSKILQDISKLEDEVQPICKKLDIAVTKFKKTFFPVKLSKRKYFIIWNKFSRNNKKYQEDFLKSGADYAKVLEIQDVTWKHLEK